MKFFTQSEMEVIARPYIAAYERFMSRFEKRCYRVEPAAMAEMLNLKVKYCHLTTDDSELGTTSVTDEWYDVFDDVGRLYPIHLDGKTVLLERNLLTTDLGMGQHNFTLMHEIAHQILSRSYPETFRQRNPVYRKRIEQQINRLGSILLLPEKYVRNALCLFQMPDGIDTLNRLFYSKEYERFCDMADFFVVSKTTLAIRLKQLGLLKRDNLNNPYEIIDIYGEDDNGNNQSNQNNLLSALQKASA